MAELSKRRTGTERYYFERWADSLGYDLRKFSDGSYTDSVTDELWGAWIARAKIDYRL